MIEKTASRIFQEMPLIERLLNKSIDTYNPTGDEGLDTRRRDALREEVPTRADGFVMCLRDIAQDMTFDEWQDFWLDMGIRIYNAEEDFNNYELFSTADYADYADEFEDNYEFHELNELLSTADCADYTDELEDNNGFDGLNG